MDRVARIVMLSRLYMLLGKHPECLPANTGEHVRTSLQLNGIDRSLLVAATEIDRLCSYTLMLHSDTSDALFAALGVIDPDRIIAMFYALPSRRREMIMRNPAWTYHLEDEPEGLAQIMAETKDWLKDADRLEADINRRVEQIPISLSVRLKRTERVMLQRLVGSAVSVNRREQEEVDESERTGGKLLANVGLIAEEITALPNPNDEHAQGEAIRRAMARMG